MTGPPADAAPRVVAVTGASGYIGGRLVERLLAQAEVARVLAIDVRPLALEHDKLTFVRHDVAEPLDGLFAEQRVEAVAHLAFVLRQLRDRAEGRRTNVAGSSNVLTACEAAGVRRIVLMSSATVYGGHPDNDEELGEESPVRPPPGFGYAEDKADCEQLFHDYAGRHEESVVSVLRACVVMGPSARNFITEALEKPLLIGVDRADPPMQFVHEDDMANVLARFVLERRPGVYNVAGPGSVPWSSVVKMSGKRLLRLPAPLAYGLTGLAWRLRLQSDAPAAGLDFVRWPWTVSTRKLQRELGFEFAHTSRQTLASYFARGASSRD